MLLVAAAMALLVAGVTFFLFMSGVGFDEPSEMFIVQTLVWPPILFVCGVRVIRSRRKKLHRRWLLVSSAVLSFSLHCTILGLTIYCFRPDWRMTEWYVIDVVELTVIGILIECAYECSAIPTALSLHGFRSHLRRLLPTIT